MPPERCFDRSWSFHEPWDSEVAATSAPSCIGTFIAACDSPDPAADHGNSPAHASPSSEDYPLVAILGPTASAKSALAVFLAERLGGEIINCDSVQVYQGLNIGSGKASGDERRRAPHHLLDVAKPDEVFTAGQYRRLAAEAAQAVRKRGKLPIVAGGAGLYLRALLEGLFDGPQRSGPVRTRLEYIKQRHGTAFMHRLLARLDPETASRIHPHDVQKMVRALEVCILAREPVSVLQRRGRAGRLAGFSVLKIGLNPDRAELYRRINSRVEAMFASGLVEETRTVQAGRNRPLEALGYRQACAVIEGSITPVEAVRAAQAATRRYAKRQMTWFRREANVRWFPGFGDDLPIQSQALESLRQALGSSPGSAPPVPDQNLLSSSTEDPSP
ncbi:MAG: tRNA (adenosine(37)-N6)-dimethylallyltransferase MiaA [Terriglobia bacterium]